MQSVYEAVYEGIFMQNRKIECYNRLINAKRIRQYGDLAGAGRRAAAYEANVHHTRKTVQACIIIISRNMGENKDRNH